MAGAGSRFAKAGYTLPKPLIPVHGVEMVKVVIDNLTPKEAHRFIFICQNSHIEEFGLNEKLKSWAKGAIVIGIDGLSEGAACTVLSAKQYINNDDHLMIANSDQYIDADINEYLAQIEQQNLDGLIMTMTANDPKWSYAGLDANGFVNNVVEKQVISEHATVGIYNFARGKDFVEAAETMIAENARVNGEFYVAPAYNRMIAEGSKIGIYGIGSEANGMYGLGIPDDLNLFLGLALSKKVVDS